MGRFTNKCILITGGTNGIGLAGAKRIAEEGGKIIATGMSQRHIEEAIRLLPSDSIVIRNDAEDPGAADELAKIVEISGGIDGLWLNAGFANVATIKDIDAGFFNHMVNVNLRAPVLQMAKLERLLHRKASVVVTSSTATYEGSPMATTYAATKGALVSITRGWASALAEREIRVNTLVPGAINTNFRDFMDKEFREKFENDVVGRVLLRRVGTAEEAAAVALFLLSDDASYVTGSQYFVDGGLSKQ